MTIGYILIGAFYSMLVGNSDPAYPWSWTCLIIALVIDILLLVFDKPTNNTPIGVGGEGGCE